jgi:hypothetical protein
MTYVLQSCDLSFAARVAGKPKQLWLRVLSVTLFVQVQRRNIPPFCLILASQVAAPTVFYNVWALINIVGLFS